MKNATAALLCLVPALASAQRVTFTERGAGAGAALVDSITAGPHVVRAGTGPLVLPRDSTVTSSIVVLGRSAYVASKVRGDVIVVGGDLYLRPGADISGRAIALGGTVAQSTLGHVGGAVESLRDETFAVSRDATGTGYSLSARSLRVGGDSASARAFRLAGIRGVKLPRYDRVDGLSLPLGVQLVLANERFLVEPTLTYRSRLGVLDPGVALRVGAEEGSRFEGRIARDTRTNDAWITPDILNSLLTLGFGTDTRNYFRSDIGEGRIFLRTGGQQSTIEPFVGGRFERVSPITAAGNVYSVFGRNDSLRARRSNPLVEAGHIASALLGVRYQILPSDAPVTAKVAVEAEQSFTAPPGTSNFSQFTLNGQVGFPTFGTQHLKVTGHAVSTLGDSVPRARYAYLGGSRTLGLSDLLQFGGTALVYVDSRYYIPVPSVQLPVVGPPTLSLIHKIGGAGVHSISPLQQEVGIGVGLGPVELEFITGASGQRRSSIGASLSLPAF